MRWDSRRVPTAISIPIPNGELSLYRRENEKFGETRDAMVSPDTSPSALVTVPFDMNPIETGVPCRTDVLWTVADERTRSTGCDTHLFHR